MKLLRYGPKDEEKPGLLDADGCIRDLFHYLTDIDPRVLSTSSLLAELSALDVSRLPIVDEPVRIGAPIGSPGKIVCVGLNSALHAEQMGFKTLTQGEMLLFMKPSSCVCGPYDPILYTRYMRKLDWEAELAIVIGKQGKYISSEDAPAHILGYTCMNDLSERYWQRETDDKQFTKGKCFDNAAPMGPYLVTRDEVKDANQLDVNLWVNGVLRQQFNTRDYIHSDAMVVSYVSQFFTLYPGDVISMGSAPGNAIAWGDACYLKPDDKVVMSIAGLGQQEQLVIVEESLCE